MIILVLCSLKNKLGKKETVVSHGVDTNTFENIVLPSVQPNKIGYYNYRLEEWILNE